MNTFNYLLGFNGSTHKVMITFRKDGKLNPIAVQKAIGEAGFVRDDWHPTIEEYTEVLCRYVANKCGCEYSCAWADFATTMCIAWADSKDVCEGEADEGGIGCEDCCEDSNCENYDTDCDNHPCDGRENGKREIIITAFFRTHEDNVAVNMVCYGEKLDVPAVIDVLSNTTEAITKAELALSVDTYVAAIAEAIESKCNCKVIAEYADLAMLLNPLD